MRNQPKISVIGVGYVGLCTAVGLASKGYTVIACDIDAEKIGKINQGIPPFFEPGLQEKLSESIHTGKLKGLVNEAKKAILETDFTYVAVGTPSKFDGSIDLKYIESAAVSIGKALRHKKSYHITIIKSTVVPGTTQNVVLPILERESGKKCGEDFGLCMNPEFLRQGSAFQDTINADRVVVGSQDKRAGDMLEVLYRDFYCSHVPPIIRTTLSTAELIKYASNAMLATKISFINTIANICEKIPGADVKVVAEAMGLDKRIGPLFLDAGLGYGGSCFPKDVKALIACAKGFGYSPELLDSTESVNKKQPLKAVEFCKQQLGSLEGKKIAILGLAFKPDTDDMREARAIPIINELLNCGACVVAYDPVAMQVAKAIFKDSIHYASSAVECLRGADCCILVTEWPEFKKLAPDQFVALMKQPILIDGRRIYDPEEYGKRLRFSAIGLGR
ncbi:MAG: UDP-glucose/GDP-mannose dehydrogenase family protein [Candidatus Bathyarchaeota archaeon]|nr:UDP-glucose/GDP-mannose dehydrogenase family protein [Candidatus Bathyarchaeota archaeon]